MQTMHAFPDLLRCREVMLRRTYQELLLPDKQGRALSEAIPEDDFRRNSMADEWILVQRRRRNTLPSSSGDKKAPNIASAYAPFSTRRSYARVTAAAPKPSSDPPSLAKPTPVTLPAHTFVFSPNSSVKLPFPPSPSHKEWRGRCFQCFEKGHLIALCPNEIRCARCGGFGHNYKRCTGALLPSCTSPPSHPPSSPPPAQPLLSKPREEPPFDQLLIGFIPLDLPTMPDDSERPEMLSCFISRDELYFEELDRLGEAIVLSVPNSRKEPLSIDEVARFFASTGMVDAAKLSVAELPSNRYLVTPPSGIDSRALCEAFPNKLWELGFSVQQWSALLFVWWRHLRLC